MTVVVFTGKMTTMWARLLKKPENSFILFGPRGTGKTTWIRKNFKDSVHYDLLDSSEFIRLERNPRILFDEAKTIAPGHWLVLDEVQKIPALMDEVHRIIENLGIKVLLCGSSARKLKRKGVNLLAGRAVMRNLYPLTSAEMAEDFNLSRALLYGSLPSAVFSSNPEDFLSAYVSMYLNEEIRAEALTRNVGAFSRFLEIASRQNSQVTNMANISRDASVAKTTVQNYFNILEDTLIAYWLKPWKLKSSNKQVSHPKFYLFDTGVARALSGRLPYQPSQEESGPLFENFMINEIKAYLDYNQLRYPIFFWRNYNGMEVDFFCETQKGFVAIEFKASSRWDRQFGKGLTRIRDDSFGNSITCLGVYQGERRITYSNIDVYPAEDFLHNLWQGNIIC